MVFKIKRDYLLRKKYCKSYISRQILKSFIKDSRLSLEERQFLKLKYNIKFKFFYSISRLKNHCVLSQNTHSVYKSVKLSRHIFKSMVLNGNLPGCL